MTSDPRLAPLPLIEPALCSYPRRLQVFPRTKVHTHYFFELAFALEDGASWEFPNHEKTVRLPQNHWILTPPNTRHAECFSKRRNPLLGWIGFTVDPASDLDTKLRDRSLRAHRCFAGTDHPSNVLDEILREQEHALDGWQLKRHLALHRLVLCLLRDATEENAPHPANLDRVIPHIHDHVPTYLDNAAFFLSEQCARPLAVSEVARFYGVSVAHFNRLFTKRFKMPPKAFQMEARNLQIKRRLEQSDDDQLSIAIACGFHDAPHLSRFFKKRNGITPQTYRNHARGGA